MSDATSEADTTAAVARPKANVAKVFIMTVGYGKWAYLETIQSEDVSQKNLA